MNMAQKKQNGKNINIPKGEDRGLMLWEITALVKAPHRFRKKTPTAIRKADTHQLIISLLYDTWARENELCHIRIEHIDLTNRIITLHTTKAYITGKVNDRFVTESKPRKVTFSQDTGTLIERIIIERKRGYLFTGHNGRMLSSRTVRHIIDHYARLLGIQKVTGYDRNGRPHYLVHAHAIREAGEAHAVLLGEMNKQTASKKAGHSIKTTQKYYLKYDIIRQRMEADKARQKLEVQFGNIV